MGRVECSGFILNSCRAGSSSSIPITGISPAQEGVVTIKHHSGTPGDCTDHQILQVFRFGGTEQDFK